MLTREQNELLCRVGPGTPMGEFMRQYWIPALRAERLVADGAPVRVRLLGQNFVAFRATDGRVGFFDEGCPHRCTSMALARNEDNALICIFHGWKIDVSGKVVEVPSEPPERRAEFAAKVRVGHYPVREAGTIIWVYIGKNDKLPQFPAFEWTTLPDSHIKSRMGALNANWLALLEGQLDSSHASILHRDGSTRRNFDLPRRGDMVYDTSPRLEFESQPYGFREGAIRDTADGRHYVRIREYVVPWYAPVPMGAPDTDLTFTMAIPIDDENAIHWDVRYNKHHPITIARSADNAGYLDNPDNFVGDFGTMENYFHQDRIAMKEGSWSGYPTVRYEDFAAAVAQGVICDRSKEYLGSSDSSIIKARRLLLEAVKQFMNGAPAFGLDRKIDWQNIRPQDITIPKDVDWRTLPR
jgi:phthalate 4,5-dioxygenase oxygenase subunit